MSTVYSPNEEFHLKIRPGDVGRYVLMCGDPARVEKIAAYFEDTAELTDDMMGEYMLGLREQTAEEVRGVCHD